MLKKVLVPVNGSELDDCALNHVKSLFRDDGIKDITLLNVFEVEISWSRGQYGMKIDLNKMREMASASAQKHVERAVSRLGSEGIAVKTAVVESHRPAEAIVEYAEKNGIDMIAIASHGYSGLKKLVFGSVADEVSHTSRVPVLLIRPEACRAEEVAKAA